MNNEIIKEDVILDTKGLSQLVWKMAFTEAIPEIVKTISEGKTEVEFHLKVMEVVKFLSNAVYQVITEDELKAIFPEILEGLSFGFLIGDKQFNMYIKKAKQKEFIKHIFENFVTTMFLMSIETILKMQQEAVLPSEDVEKDIEKEFVVLEGGKPEKPTVSE